MIVCFRRHVYLWDLVSKVVQLSTEKKRSSDRSIQGAEPTDDNYIYMCIIERLTGVMGEAMRGVTRGRLSRPKKHHEKMPEYFVYLMWLLLCWFALIVKAERCIH